MKKLLAIILAALMLVPMLAACDRSGTQKGDYKVAMITDYGDITDQSFNQTTYEACKDIKGGQNAGLDTCWFNLKNEENKSNIHPKFEIGSYEDLYKIVMEPEELENIGVRNRRHSNEA